MRFAATTLLRLQRFQDQRPLTMRFSWPSCGSQLIFLLVIGGFCPQLRAQMGDFNNDGVYDCLDVQPLSLEIIEGTNAPLYDLTEDGLVDRDDLTSWLTEAGAAQLPNGAPYLYGDVDFTGVVDFAADWDIWQANKLTYTPGYCSADYNTDGVVDVQDFQIVAANMLQFSDPAIGVGADGPQPGSPAQFIYDSTSGNLFADAESFLMTSYFIEGPPLVSTSGDLRERTLTGNLLVMFALHFEDAMQMQAAYIFGDNVVDGEMLIGQYASGLTPDAFGDVEYGGTGGNGNQNHGPYRTSVTFTHVLPGDANLDGFVDIQDFNRWNENKFSNDGRFIGWGKGDFNTDGVVDVSDFNIWNDHKFTASNVASVPEPGTGLMLIASSGLALCSLVGRRKR